MQYRVVTCMCLSELVLQAYEPYRGFEPPVVAHVVCDRVGSDLEHDRPRTLAPCESVLGLTPVVLSLT